jgi:hypothetical protein
MTNRAGLDGELRELLEENGADPRAYAHLAAGLQAELESPVMMRPEFRVELRTRLMAEARERLRRPWWRRPLVWSSLGGVAAAAVVLTIGLRLYTGGERSLVPGSDLTTPPVTHLPEAGKEPTGTAPGLSGTPHRVSSTKLPVLHLADEQRAGTIDQAGGALDPSAELPVYVLTGQVNEALFQTIADRFGMSGGSPTSRPGEFGVTLGARTLKLQTDGHLTYEDASPAPSPTGETQVADPATVATTFLQQVQLPVVEAHPSVREEAGHYLVIYQDRYLGRPIVNGATRVWVSRAGVIRRLDTFTPAGQQYDTAYTAVPLGEALAKASALGGSFTSGDLVWVRTPSGDTVYLQPYWRLFGTDQQGQPVVRYLPALQR